VTEFQWIVSASIRTIKKHLFNSAVWPDFTLLPNPENAILNLVQLRVNESIHLNGYSVTPISVNHTVPAVGYLVEGKKDKRFFYTGDTGPTALTWKKIKNKKINCLIIDVSFPKKLNALAIKTGHLTPDLLKKEILQIIPMPEMICITHPKPQYFSTIKRELQKLKLKNLMILKDGDIIRI